MDKWKLDLVQRAHATADAGCADHLSAVRLPLKLAGQQDVAKARVRAWFCTLLRGPVLAINTLTSVKSNYSI